MSWARFVESEKANYMSKEMEVKCTYDLHIVPYKETEGIYAGPCVQPFDASDST